MCFCFARKAVVIIDGSKEGDDRDLRLNYGDIPGTLVGITNTYLRTIYCLIV